MARKPGEPAPGLPPPERRCKAKSKQRQARCMMWTVPGKAVCRYHGGLSTGPKHGSGRYSKSLGKLAAAYEESLADKSLLDLREPIAVLDAISKGYADRVDRGDTTKLRATAVKLFNEAVDAQENGDLTKMAMRLGELGKLLRNGADEDRAMVELANQIVRTSRVVKDAWDVKLSRRSAINARDLVAIFARFVDIVRHIAGGDVARQVADRIDSELIDRRN